MQRRSRIAGADGPMRLGKWTPIEQTNITAAYKNRGRAAR